MKHILVISPHADDGELWAGASMARWAAGGADVQHLCLSAKEDQMAAPVPVSQRRSDAA
jgi:LmbE family N-acetylglucosaminyl deacetylase